MNVTTHSVASLICRVLKRCVVLCCVKNNQKDLENVTEQLSEYLERDITMDTLSDIKQKVQDMSRLAASPAASVYCSYHLVVHSSCTLRVCSMHQCRSTALEHFARHTPLARHCSHFGGC